jgi:DNA-3-methyladenine glycosylase II
MTALTGIGKWTADVYLQMALRRPDIWPVGDLALRAAVQGLYGLEGRPNEVEMEAYGERWRPNRSAAAMILWHGYLEGVVVP